MNALPASDRSAVRAGQTVNMLFHVPHTRKQKRYLEALEAGMDTDAKVPGLTHWQQSPCKAHHQSHAQL